MHAIHEANVRFVYPRNHGKSAHCIGLQVTSRLAHEDTTKETRKCVQAEKQFDWSPRTSRVVAALDIDLIRIKSR